MSDKWVAHISIDLEDLVPEFLENRQQDVISLKEMAQGGDFDTIKRIGHNLKGSGGGYGFDEITEIGARIEEAAKENDEKVIIRETESLSDYLTNVTIVWEDD